MCVCVCDIARVAFGNEKARALCVEVGRPKTSGAR